MGVHQWDQGQRKWKGDWKMSGNGGRSMEKDLICGTFWGRKEGILRGTASPYTGTSDCLPCWLIEASENLKIPSTTFRSCIFIVQFVLGPDLS